MSMLVFWILSQYGLVGRYWRFEDMLNMETECFYKMLVPTYKSTCRYNLEYKRQYGTECPLCDSQLNKNFTLIWNHIIHKRHNKTDNWTLTWACLTEFTSLKPIYLLYKCTNRPLMIRFCNQQIWTPPPCGTFFQHISTFYLLS
jgi:hypothetical protein